LIQALAASFIASRRALAPPPFASPLRIWLSRIAPMAGERQSLTDTAATREFYSRHAVLPLGDPGIYTSVLVAAFGGVHTSLLSHGAKVHPLCMLLLCLPLFVVQSATFLYVWAELDLQTKVYDVNDPENMALMKLKWVMVIIVFLTNHSSFKAGISHILFLINPLTWFEVRHPRRVDWALLNVEAVNSASTCLLRASRIMASTPFLAFCALNALVLKFINNMMICAVCVNIILSAGTAKDAIFNGLAVGFVMELDKVWWVFCSETFHLSPMEDFEFDLDETVWHSDGTAVERKVNAKSCARIIALTNEWTRLKSLGLRHSFLRVGHGGNRTREVAVSLFLLLIYGRQLMVMLDAMHEGRLPAVYAACFEIRFAKLVERGTPKWFQTSTNAMFVGLQEHISKIHENHSEERCQGLGIAIDGMTVHKMFHLSTEYPIIVLLYFVTGLALLLLPVLAYHVSHTWFGIPEKSFKNFDGSSPPLPESTESDDSDESGDIANSSDFQERLRHVEARLLMLEKAPACHRCSQPQSPRQVVARRSVASQQAQIRLLSSGQVGTALIRPA